MLTRWKEEIVNSSKTSITIFSGLLALLILVGQGMAQEPRFVEAKIPFEFWVEDSSLPAGDYRIEHVESTAYLLFRSTDGKVVKDAYTLPLDETPVKESDAKLVFRIQSGTHYLYGGWGPYGKRVITSESVKPAPSGKDRVEIPLIYHH
jgi:hypothetical protein